MGIYFIAAGISSKNRFKTLDFSHQLEKIIQLVPQPIIRELEKAYSQDEPIYIWGANDRSLEDLRQVKPGEYVVDVKNAEVKQIFMFCFYYKTTDQRLQEFVGWDDHLPRQERRPYRYVFFLKNPSTPKDRDKKFFQKAFSQELNSNWLVGQRYFNDLEEEKALRKAFCSSVEEFLGISHPMLIPETVHPTIDASFLSIIAQIAELKKDPLHQERAHESLVENFFHALGYKSFKDIRHRQGRIDLSIQKEGKTLLVAEVKRDWMLTMRDKSVLQQAYQYALETGARFVMITNGDYYAIYDRSAGLSYESNFQGEFVLTALKDEDLSIINSLRAGNL